LVESNRDNPDDQGYNRMGVMMMRSCPKCGRTSEVVYSLDDLSYGLAYSDCCGEYLPEVAPHPDPAKNLK
jgi:hypothetical protein